MIPLHTALTPADIHHLHTLYGGEVVRDGDGFRLVGATIAGVVQDFYAAGGAA
jgi:hypothetical protein